MTAEQALEYTHGRVTMNLTVRLATYLRASPAGRLCPPGTRFTTSRSPDTVRTPDIAFIRADRLPDREPAATAPPMPDLVVDILSPKDRPLEIQSRAGEWLAAGTSLVWVVDPRRCTVHVYRADGTEEFVGSSGALNGEELLPGFSCPINEIF